MKAPTPRIISSAANTSVVLGIFEIPWVVNGGMIRSDKNQSRQLEHRSAAPEGARSGAGGYRPYFTTLSFGGPFRGPESSPSPPSLPGGGSPSESVKIMPSPDSRA